MKSPSSFTQAMEELVKEAPCASSVDRKPKGILTIEHKKEAGAEVEAPSKPPPAEPLPEPEPKSELVKVEAHVTEAISDLLVIWLTIGIKVEYISL